MELEGMDVESCYTFRRISVHYVALKVRNDEFLRRIRI